MATLLPTPSPSPGEGPASRSGSHHSLGRIALLGEKWYPWGRGLLSSPTSGWQMVGFFVLSAWDLAAPKGGGWKAAVFPAAKAWLGLKTIYKKTNTHLHSTHRNDPVPSPKPNFYSIFQLFFESQWVTLFSSCYPAVKRVPLGVGFFDSSRLAGFGSAGCVRLVASHRM